MIKLAGNSAGFVASGVETSLKELASMLCTVMDVNIAPVHEVERNVNPVSRRLADVETAFRAIGFRAEISLEAGLKELSSWWKRKNTNA